jgi:cell division protein FtsB
VIVLDIAKTIMIGILLVASINLLSRMANQTQQTRTLTQQNQNLTRQIKSLSEQNKALSEQVKTDTDIVNAHLDCIVNYFTTPHRTGNTTLNPNTCEVSTLTSPKASAQ